MKKQEWLGEYETKATSWNFFMEITGCKVGHYTLLITNFT